jgi:hypothetical protein
MTCEVKSVSGNKVELMDVSTREYYFADNFENIDLRSGDMVYISGNRMHRTNR